MAPGCVRHRWRHTRNPDGTITYACRHCPKIETRPWPPVTTTPITPAVAYRVAVPKETTR